MSSNELPGYDLDRVRVVTAPGELRAMFHELRGTLLELLLERAATVAELAAAVGRPKSTVAHHIGVLLDAGLVKVVRTRRVRAIDERCYGRTARIFYVGAITPAEAAAVPIRNGLAEAAAEAAPAHQADQLRVIVRHARIPAERAAEFWDRVFDLANEFMQLPRSGDTVHGFAAGLYPTEHPTLPEPGED